MSRLIEINWVELGLSVTAELKDDKNPKLASFFWDSLPYNTLQNHALVSGDHLYHMTPFRDLVYSSAQYKEDRTRSPDGTLFLSHLQHLAIKYGPLTEYLSAAAIGDVIPEHIPRLKQVGDACWEAVYRRKQNVEVQVTRKGEPATKFVLPRSRPVQSQRVQALMDEIQSELERVWIHPPQELVDIHEGRIASGAGSRNQYFATMVFVNGETRPLGYGALGGLIKSCQQSDISLDSLKQITGNFIKVPSEFLGYCGLNILWDFTQRTLEVIGDLKTKEEYLSLISTLAMYVYRLNGWNLQLFPWHHGDQYQYNVSQEIELEPTGT